MGTTKLQKSLITKSKLRFWFRPWSNLYLFVFCEMTKEVMNNTQLRIVGSIPSTNNSSLQVSSLHKVSSLAVVKGKAKLPQIHIMWSALGQATLPCGSRTTRIGFFPNFHSFLTNSFTTRSITEGWWTVYHGIVACNSWNCLCLASVHGATGSTIGTQTTSYWLSGLVGYSRDSLYICSRIETSSCEMSRSDMRSNTFFRFKVSTPT